MPQGSARPDGHPSVGSRFEGRTWLLEHHRWREGGGRPHHKVFEPGISHAVIGQESPDMLLFAWRFCNAMPSRCVTSGKSDSERGCEARLTDQDACARCSWVSFRRLRFCELRHGHDEAPGRAKEAPVSVERESCASFDLAWHSALSSSHQPG